jgi:hypothetical protein
MLAESLPSITHARTGLEAARILVGLGKGQELSDDIAGKIEDIRKIEETAQEERVAKVRHTAESLGDMVVIIHFVYIFIVVVGLILVLVGAGCNWQWVRNIWFRSIHLTMILIVVVEAILSIECPLTTWERDLKRCAGLKAQEGGFIARWMHNMIICDGVIDPESKDDSRKLEMSYIAFGSLVLASFWLAPPCRRKKLECNPPPPTDQAPAPP